LIKDLTTIQCITRYVGNYYRYELTPELATALRDSLSRGQLMSKISLLQLSRNYVDIDNSAFFIGHWHGLLPLMFHDYGLVKYARGIELDPFWVEFSNQLNSHWEWKSSIEDADTFIFPNYKTIVNTSCEHMSDNWIKHVPVDALVCAQSTDFIHTDHNNIVKSLDEFLEKWKGFSILETASEEYDIYSRFTVIARKK
jgi:hypothetical protein